MKKLFYAVFSVLLFSCGTEEKSTIEKPIDSEVADTISAETDTAVLPVKTRRWPAGWHTAWKQVEEVNGKFYSVCNGINYEIDTMSNRLTEMDSYSAAEHELYRTVEFKDRLRLYCASVYADHPEDTLIIDFLRQSEDNALVSIRFYSSYAKNKNEFSEHLCYAIINGEAKPLRKPCTVGLQ